MAAETNTGLGTRKRDGELVDIASKYRTNRRNANRQLMIARPTARRYLSANMKIDFRNVGLRSLALERITA